jgi:YD repeat-containing protein
LGSSTPFSPESRYLIYPPGSKGGFKDYLLANLGIYKVLFHVKIDKLGAVDFYSYNFPGYAVRRSSDHLMLTDFNTNREYLFASFDGGESWKLEILRDRYQPSLAIKCKYNDEGLVSEIVLPGERSYKIEHRFGVAQKVTSPSGAVTTFTWNEEDSTLARIKTELTKEHPFYKFAPKPKQVRRGFGQKQEQEQLPIVRDLHVECDITNRLTGLVTTGGERYTAEYLREPTPKGVIVTGILTFPDGTKKFRRNTNFKGKRLSETGIVVTENGKSKFIVLGSHNYTSKNKGLAYIGQMKNGVRYKYERSSGTLAITAEINPLGQRTRYNYNKFGLRNETIYPDGGKITLKFDNNANLISRKDECGRVKTYTRNNVGELIKYTYGGLTTKYEYDSNGMPVKTTMPDGTVHLFEWDKQFRMVSHTKPDGVKVKYAYYGNQNHLESITTLASGSAEEYKQSFLYDIQGRLTQINYPDKTYESFDYDCCNIISQRSRAGAVTRYKYDNGHRKIEEIRASGEVYRNEYDSRGYLVKRAMPDKTAYIYTYNKYGRRLSQINPVGITEKYSRNALGRLVKTVRQPGGAQSQTKYDRRNRILRICGSLERNIACVYDKSGNVLKFSDYGLPTAKQPRVTKYKYDKSNRRIQEINPEGVVRKIVFRSGSTQLDYILREEVYRFMSYDKYGRLASVSEVTAEELKQAPTQAEKAELLKSKRVEARSYDAFGNLAESRDGKGRLLAKYAYQPDGELLSVLRPVSEDSGELFSYRYRYTSDGEKVTSIYKRLVPLKQQTAQK